jgi:hypothetical protein
MPTRSRFRWRSRSACASSPPRDERAAASVSVPRVGSADPAEATWHGAGPDAGGGAEGAATLSDDEPLRAGLVRFEGMVLRTKGELSVRGLTLDEETLLGALAPPLRVASMDGALGAKVRLTAELIERESSGPERRAERYLLLGRLVRAELVAEAEALEGVVSRTKGLYEVGSRLVVGRDLEVALGAARADLTGKRVRLFGQRRDVPCAGGQCMAGGTLPMFEVARGELVP